MLRGDGCHVRLCEDVFCRENGKDTYVSTEFGNLWCLFFHGDSLVAAEVVPHWSSVRSVVANSDFCVVFLQLSAPFSRTTGKNTLWSQVLRR